MSTPPTTKNSVGQPAVTAFAGRTGPTTVASARELLRRRTPIGEIEERRNELFVTGVEQWFGTKSRIRFDEIEAYPIDDPVSPDVREAQYGLEPHTEKGAALRQQYGRATA